MRAGYSWTVCLAAALFACVMLSGVGRAEDSAAGAREAARTDADARPLVCKVFLQQYRSADDPTERAAALPYAPLEDANRSVKIRRVNSAEKTAVRVKETGPWNTNDAYWHPESRRTWEGLPRCVPEAQAAYRHGYNGGRDQFGRDVLSPAGIDVTPPVARDLGLKRWEQGAWVYVTFPWVRR